MTDNKTSKTCSD